MSAHLIRLLEGSSEMVCVEHLAQGLARVEAPKWIHRRLTHYLGSHEATIRTWMKATVKAQLLALLPF